MPIGPVAGQSIGGGFRADVIGGGILLEKPFEFLDPVYRAVGGTARAQQAADGQPVNCGRRAAESLCGLNPVQRQFRNQLLWSMIFDHALNVSIFFRGNNRLAKNVFCNPGKLETPQKISPGRVG